MAIIGGEAELCRYLARAKGEILVDHYLEGRELDVDAVGDGETVLIPGILEQLEPSGIHSGDSYAAYPPPTLSPGESRQVVEHTTSIARAFQVRGLMNVQFVVRDGIAYVLEVNPRASRTVPFLSKVTGVPMVALATDVALGSSLRDLGQADGLMPARSLHAVKAAVFSTEKLRGVDPALGPEMRSTGEAIGVAGDARTAVRKARLAAGVREMIDEAVPAGTPEVDVATLHDYLAAG
jgi:carbamoyl-phosphate synthase large subunit